MTTFLSKIMIKMCHNFINQVYYLGDNSISMAANAKFERAQLSLAH